MANVIYTFTGASQSQVAAATGIVGVKLWAGAGGGALRVGSPYGGGAGGFVQFNIFVNAGDVLRVDVGEGGKAGKTGVGGLGGWPNGGFGSRTSTRSAGGGGGRTAFYVNGALRAVAGAGGGNGGVSTQQGGAGAAPKGEDSYLEPGTAATTGGTGGTQTTGGVDNSAPTNIPKRGGSLFGGKGGDVVDNITVTTDQGGGGGDGYFGGGGGGNDSQSGGGGSSWCHADCDDVTFSNYDLAALTDYVLGTFRTPWQEQYELAPEYVAGIAVGGLPSATSASTTNGGNGWARIGDPIPPNEVRASGLATLVLGIQGNIVETSGLATLVLGSTATGMRTFQGAVLVLAAETPCVSRWCQCWLFERLDGEEFAFTSHDEPIAFLGRTFSPCRSLQASATEAATDIAAIGNMELSGIIASDAISDFDLFTGKFDGCKVSVYEIAWGAPFTTPLRLAAGKIGNVSQGRDGFRAEVLGIGAQMQQQAITQVVTPACRFTFGDARCTIDLVPLTETGAVTATSIGSANRVFAASGVTGFADDYFERGVVTFTSGTNIGLRSEVKEYDGTTGTFVLWQEMGARIEIGDAFTVTPGCDLSKPTCRDVWANLINFGGFPDVPGDDAVARTPNAQY